MAYPMVCNQCWYSVGQPVVGRLGAYESLETTWVNTGNSNLVGITIAVVHNNLGQTVEISTAILDLAIGANGTASPVVFGLVSGEYSASVFVVTAGGVAISTTVSVPLFV